jgi:hypothetical protein
MDIHRLVPLLRRFSLSGGTAMRMFKSPQPGHCASCEGVITGRPVYRMDEAYCCVGCVAGGPCVCNYEADLADDGVDGLGLPFSIDASFVGAEASERLVSEPLASERRARERLFAPRAGEPAR